MILGGDQLEDADNGATNDQYWHFLLLKVAKINFKLFSSASYPLFTPDRKVVKENGPSWVTSDFFEESNGLLGNHCGVWTIEWKYIIRSTLENKQWVTGTCSLWTFHHPIPSSLSKAAPGFRLFIKAAFPFTRAIDSCCKRCLVVVESSSANLSHQLKQWNFW